jgi:hypothetical protein
MIIIRAVFSLAVLALVGVLVTALSGQLWARYEEETAALGFSGIYERLAAQAGLTDDRQAYGVVAQGDRAPLPGVQDAAAVEE